MTRCERCRSEAVATTGSYFNTDLICLDCAEAERQHPDFERARRVEAEAMQRGDFNFPGIGLPADLRRYDDDADAIRLILDEAQGDFDPVQGCWLVSMSDLSSSELRRRFLVYVGPHPEAPSWEEVDE